MSSRDPSLASRAIRRRRRRTDLCVFQRDRDAMQPVANAGVVGRRARQEGSPRAGPPRGRGAGRRVRPAAGVVRACSGLAAARQAARTTPPRTASCRCTHRAECAARLPGRCRTASAACAFAGRGSAATEDSAVQTRTQATFSSIWLSTIRRCNSAKQRLRLVEHQADLARRQPLHAPSRAVQPQKTAPRPSRTSPPA